MNIDSIQNGVVLDHIQAGKSMDIYKYLHLDELDCQVAIIKNARSAHMGKKDIIKIDYPLDLDLDVLGYIDSNITVNIIRDGKRVEKKHLELPHKLVNAKSDLSILHPLPRVNEIAVAVDKDPRAAYWRQVKNGKFIRMALIMKLLGVEI